MYGVFELFMKTPLTYYGGKQSMTRTIVPRLHPHTCYVEPFCGGAAVFFAKEPAPIETLNDTNAEITNFFSVVQTKKQELTSLVVSTSHSRRAHSDARVVYQNPHLFNPVKRAWAVWVLAHQSFAHDFHGAFRFSRSVRSTTSNALARKRDTFDVHTLAQRIKYVQLECDDALTIIQRYDTPHTLFYCDPPYFNAHMGHYGGYTEQDFYALLKSLSAIQGTFLLSSYPSDTLQSFTSKHGWYTQCSRRRIVNSPQGHTKSKTEVLTANYNTEFIAQEYALKPCEVAA